MSDAQNPDNSGQVPHVTEIAKWVLGISGAAILVISAVTLLGSALGKADTFPQTSQLVFNSLLPLLGTWVGTVLAYYFSTKNFESASQSVQRMVGTLTTEQKLGQMFVEKEMIGPGQIVRYKIEAGKTPKEVPLKTLLSLLGEKITRIPIVDANDAVLYIVHQSGLYKFVTNQTLKGRAVDIDVLTLQDLIDDAQIKNWVSNIVFVPESASVADAKKAMEAQTGCQDLIVTKTGSKTEPMLGWMTNVDIGRLSKA